MLRSCLLLGAAVGVLSGSPAKDFEFPKRMMWDYVFTQNTNNVTGTGRGVVDWTKDSVRPDYLLQERFKHETANGTAEDPSNIVQSRISGKMGLYTYTYLTADGRVGCLPASFTTFPRKMFSKDTWTGTTIFKAQACDRYLAYNPTTGAQGSLELTVCQGVPVMSLWTTYKSDGKLFQQRSYTTAFEDLTKSPVAIEQSNVFETCTPMNAMRLIASEGHEAPEVPAVKIATEAHEAPEVIPQTTTTGAATAGAATAAGAGAAKIPTEAHEVPEVPIALKGTDAHEVPEVQPSLGGTIGGTSQSQQRLVVTKEAEVAPSKEGLLAAAQAELERQRAEIEKWKVDKKAQADNQAQLAKGGATTTEDAVKAAEERKEEVEREAERRALDAEAQYAAAVARVIALPGDATQTHLLTAAHDELLKTKAAIQQWKATMKSEADKTHDLAKTSHTDAARIVRQLSRDREIIEVQADKRLREAENNFKIAVRKAGLELSATTPTHTQTQVAQDTGSPLFAILGLFLASSFVVMYARTKKSMCFFVTICDSHHTTQQVAFTPRSKKVDIKWLQKM